MQTAIQDVRYGLRLLRRSPVFAAVAVLTLALGIGANTAIFSVVNAVLLRPLPYPSSERIFLVSERWRGMLNQVSVGNFADWKALSTVFDRISALDITSFNLDASESPERLRGERVSDGFFETFRMQPLRGRFFTPEENQPGREQVVVLSEKLWRSRFAGDPAIVDREIRVNGVPFKVVGIAPASFDPVANQDQLWVPAAFTSRQLGEHDEHYLLVFGRLKDGISQQQAQSELDVIAKREQERFPIDDAERGIGMQPLEEALYGDLRPTFWMLLGAVGLVLLIACANVANLQLARASARRREIAVRRALGATGWRLARQILAESLVLSLLGALGGLVLAHWGTRALILASPSDIPRVHEAGIDLRTLMYSGLLAVLSSVIFGLAPARRAAALRLNESFREQSPTVSASASRDPVRSAIVVCQIALALMLVVGAGLLMRSIWLAQRVPLGFDAQGVLVGRVTLPAIQFNDAEKLKAGFEGIIEKATNIPGVQGAAMVSRAPFRGGGSNGLVPEGRPMTPASAINSQIRVITPDYFNTLRMQLKRGRWINEQDERNTPKVMVINETLAKAAFAGQDPVGKRIACCESGPDKAPAWHEVVGVVGDAHAWGLEQNILPEFYLPMKQAPAASWSWLQNTMDLVVRAEAGPSAITGELRRAVAEVAPGVPLYSVSTMPGAIAGSQDQQRFYSYLLGLFATLALLLAAVGIYGVLSYMVAQRTREIGIRMALGASRGNVLRLILENGLKLTTLGVAFGVGGAILATRLLVKMLFGVRPLDLVSFCAGALILVAISVLASYLPARRATKVDPMVALRYE